eukprot:1151377-Pelagomonas_calceolata.AAC.1
MVRSYFRVYANKSAHAASADACIQVGKKESACQVWQHTFWKAKKNYASRENTPHINFRKEDA